MITALRHFVVDTWIGRVIALVLFLAFVGLGGSFVGLSGGFGGLTPQDVTQVGPYKVTVDDVEREIQKRLNYLQQSGVSPEALRGPGVAEDLTQESLRDVVVAKAAQAVGEKSGINPSDALVRQTVFSMPEFADAQGQFSAQKMDQLLTQSGMSHQDLVNQVQQTLMMRTMMFGFGQAPQVPSAEIEQIVQFYTRARKVDIARFPFSEGQVSGNPTEQQLHRFYDNHPWMFRTAEFRHVKIVTLLPDSVAASIEVPDDVLQKLYKERGRDYNLPELRTVQVLGFADMKSAEDAAQAWRSGARWEDVQKQFPSAIPASLSDARQGDFPDPALGKAVFSASAQSIVGPVKTAAGWSVIHVVTVTPAHVVTFEQARDGMRSEIRHAETATRLGQVMKPFEEAVAGSTELDKIPTNLGAVPGAGTLDERGMTPEGEAAPLPGDEATRKAILHQIFLQKKGELPHVVSLPNGGAFAVLVDQVKPGHVKAFNDARADVVTAWQDEQKKHAQDTRVTSLYQDAKKNGLRAIFKAQQEKTVLQKDEIFSRLHPRNDVPELITRAAFDQKIGQTVMLEVGDAYWLVQVTGEQEAEPSEENMLRQKVGQQLQQEYAGDLPEALGMAYLHQVPVHRQNYDIIHQITTQLQQRMSGNVR
ncbi:peptidyl-prolyl cis-trans isomerase [Saccharibacter sp. 17.LH.SD]|uniref:peptidylprolyl isomerase n=1 Tax=Saccharibacter sp. 17.LH.SD TaxID=2689393 RepID=UPI001F026C16|nr:peptidyl-prolyl cis-trans isomerase [Saccharibacter sp. 17.LH.SD]